MSREHGRREAITPRRLPELTADEQVPKLRRGLRSVGVGRAVPRAALQDGKWASLPNGSQVWRVAIQSPHAWGLRLHFNNFAVGGGHVWVYVNDPNAPTEAYAGPYTGKGPHGDGEFWSEPVEGESVVIEYAPGTGSPTEGEVPFQVDQLSHFFSKPVRQAVARGDLNPARSNGADRELTPLASGENGATSSTCSPDVSCYSEWSTAANAVASITFVIGGDSYMCTGSLIEDSGKTGQPLFLTADHCISDDATARTVVAHFRYQSSTCNGPIPPYYQVPRVSGAKYLVSRPIAQGDFSLMLLSSAAPAGSTFLSWSGASEPPVGDRVIGIHHPGMLADESAPNSKKISFGQKSTPQTTYVESDIMPASVNIGVDWLPGQGYTEPGSSGSPLLSSTGKLLGTLTGGDEGTFYSACNPSYAVAVYGKFSAALPTLTPFLGTSAAGGSTSTPAPSATTCTYGFPGGNATIPASGGSGSIPVTMGSGCGLPAVPTRAWLSTSAMPYTGGNGSIVYYAYWNPSSAPRAAAIQTGSQAVQVLQKGTGTPAPYTDVPATNQWFDYVAIAKNAGIISGCTATDYCPEAPMTRSDMAAFLIRSIYGSGAFTYNSTPYFADVPETHPNFPYIQKLKELGITTGCNTTPALYCPADTVTRAQMAVFLVVTKVGRSFTYTPNAYFDDAPVGSWAFAYIQKMKDLGITAGCGERMYCSDEGNTRGQMAVFLTRAFVSGVGF